MQPLSRRDFLHASGAVALGAGLAACSKAKPPAKNPRSLAAVVAGRSQNVNLISASEETLALPGGVRFPFALFVPNTTNDHYTGGTARLWIAFGDQSADALGPFDAQWHDEGLGDKGIYTAHIPFAKNGSWLMFVEGRPTGVVAAGEAKPAAITAVGGTTVGVGMRAQMPIPGGKAIAVATPTFSNAGGVKPICTRHPACSMHDLSLDAALRNGKPTVLTIATPQFCTSRTCGPVVDIIDGVRRSSGSGVNFVHIEVFKDDRDAPAKQILSPAAEKWHTEFEPATYFISADGTIADRFVGAAARDEVAAAVQRLKS